ncbi:MAG: PQQ-binding-like beta-propeller repeat protein [Planctomycetes bacterium]|nr:PQQ-binding-like beta-propeller repeat protein [Planctomycetota bacterium]
MIQESERIQVWRRAARSTAIVGGVFTGIFVALLIANLIGSAILGPSRENKLAAMKLQVQKDPTNQTLLSEVRQLDLKIRRDRIWRLDFAHKAAHMLLASVVVLLVAGKIAYDLGKVPPRPGHATDRGEIQVKEAKRARWAVAGGLAMLAAGMTLVGMSGSVEFAQAEEAGPPFASMEERLMQWPRFRGPGGAGVSAYTNIPTSWNGKTGENILWKSPVPMSGRNSPVVWKDRIFLTGADPNVRQVYCYDAKSGQLLWKGDVPTVSAAAKLEIMEDTGYAACTAATDGRRIYAIFPTGDVAAFDFNGRRLWHKNLGVPDSSYGYASSLETYEKLVLVQYDQGDGTEGKSKVIALDGVTGRVAWEAKRTLPNSWATPVVVQVEGKPQLITLADPNMVAYSPATGEEIWRAECLGGDLAPSPIYAGGLVMAIQPYSQLVAVKPTGQGDVTKTHVAWKMEEGGPDICSPVSDGTYVYLLESADLLICCRVETGEKIYEQEIKGDFRASPSLVGDKLYVLDMKGMMRIFQAGLEFKELGKCELGEECFASPAFADGRIYIRGAANLYCIGQAQ